MIIDKITLASTVLDGDEGEDKTEESSTPSEPSATLLDGDGDNTGTDGDKDTDTDGDKSSEGGESN